MTQQIEQKRTLIKVKDLLRNRTNEISLNIQEVVDITDYEKVFLDLKEYVTTIPTEQYNGQWKAPVISDEILEEVDGTEASSEIEEVEFTDINFSQKLYRGKFIYSQENLDDCPGAAEKHLLLNARKISLNTQNFQIAKTFKGFSAKTISNFDALKTLINLDLGSKYCTKLFLSDSAYNALDLLKDAEGRYLLKEIKREIVVLPDTYIGSVAGDRVGFVGDAKAAVIAFVRKELTIKWSDHLIYGQQANVVTPIDVHKVDEAAGYYITFNFN